MSERTFPMSTVEWIVNIQVHNKIPIPKRFISGDGKFPRTRNQEPSPKFTTTKAKTMEQITTFAQSL